MEVGGFLALDFNIGFEKLYFMSIVGVDVIDIINGTHKSLGIAFFGEDFNDLKAGDEFSGDQVDLPAAFGNYNEVVNDVAIVEVSTETDTGLYPLRLLILIKTTG